MQTLENFMFDQDKDWRHVWLKCWRHSEERIEGQAVKSDLKFKLYNTVLFCDHIINIPGSYQVRPQNHYS